jgi:acetylornithine/succinyldiaminopimelate/putrescine aminotransferase
VALRILDVIENEQLADNVRETGAWLASELTRISRRQPGVIKSVRGLGFMIGIELAAGITAFSGGDKPPAIQFVNQLHEAGVLTIPSGAQVIRLLPALNLRRQEAQEGIEIIETLVNKLASR